MDESVNEVNSIGVAAIGLAASAMSGRVLSDSNVSVSLAGGNILEADNYVNIGAKHYYVNADVLASIKDLLAKDKLTEDEEKKLQEAYKKMIAPTSKVAAKALGAAGGIGGAGLAAIARDTGDVSLTIGGGNNSLKAGLISLYTSNSPNLLAETGALGASVIGSISSIEGETSLGTKDNHIQANLAVSSGTTIDSEFIAIVNELQPLQTTNMKSLSASVGGGVQENTAKGDAYTDAKLELGKLNVADKAGLMQVMALWLSMRIKWQLTRLLLWPITRMLQL